MSLDMMSGTSGLDVSMNAKPPLIMRRHSMGQTSHKFLHEEDRDFFDALHDLRDTFGARPDSPTADQNVVNDVTSVDTLAARTLGDLFGEYDERKRRALLPDASHKKALRDDAYTPHATHTLELNEQLFRTKLPKTAAHATELPVVGPGKWLEALARRKASAKEDSSALMGPSPPMASVVTRAASFNDSAPPLLARAASLDSKPPAGWAPTLKTIKTVIKLRRMASGGAIGTVGQMHDRRASNASELSSASTVVPASAADDDSTHVTAADLTSLAAPGFDVQSFVEECWRAQALTDLGRNEAILENAYEAPSVGMHHAAGWTGAHTAPPAAFAPVANVYAPMAYDGYGGIHPAERSVPQVWAQAQMEGMAAQAWRQQMVRMNAPMLMAPRMQMAPMAPMAPQMAPMAAQMAPMAAQMAPPMARMTPLVCGTLASMAAEQEGSRILQQRLGAMPPAELAAAIAELAPSLAHLATDAFGNYLVSSMARLPAAHTAVHEALAGQLCRLMQHPQGSRVTQAAFESLPAPLSASLVREMLGHVAEVASGTHGSWSCVAAYTHTRAPFILRELAAALPRLSTHQNGSRVVQRVMIDAATRTEDISAPVAALIALGHAGLAQMADDKFGNYVVQIGLEHAQAGQRQQLISMLLPAFHELALGKCGSNVAEMLTEVASRAQLDGVRTALGEHADSLRTHPFGSYVMSKLDARHAA